jgi:hypothetical protein
LSRCVISPRPEKRAHCRPIGAGCCSTLNCKAHIQIRAFCYRMAMSLLDLGLLSRALTRPARLLLTVIDRVQTVN